MIRKKQTQIEGIGQQVSSWSLLKSLDLIDLCDAQMDDLKEERKKIANAPDLTIE